MLQEHFCPGNLTLSPEKEKADSQWLSLHLQLKYINSFLKDFEIIL